MSKTRKLLIGLGIIGIIGYFAIWYDSGGCDLYIGDDKCNEGYRPFRQKDWTYQDDPNGNIDRFFYTNCIREAMICDLTQNIIPIGTPYEKVVALLGEGDEHMSPRVREKDEDLLKKYNLRVLNEYKIRCYTSGSSVSGPNCLVILFEHDSVYGFIRTIAI